jgi:hypothetical protein
MKKMTHFHNDLNFILGKKTLLNFFFFLLQRGLMPGKEKTKQTHV